MLSKPEAQVRPLGAIHGRFQPFHNGHLAYLEAALTLFETVIVGITNPLPSDSDRTEATDPLRHLPENNPFNFFERLDMIVESCCLRDVPVVDRIRVVPFDVTGPTQLWPSVMPLRAVQVVMPYEPWDEEKAYRFAEFGYEVELLPTTQDRLSATDVRALLKVGDPTWQQLVPSGTARVLGRLDSQGRLLQGGGLPGQ